MNRIHVYQQRHVFSGDNYIGKFNRLTGTIAILAAFAHEQDAARHFFGQELGINARTLVGDKEVLDATPPGVFPPEIRAQMTPTHGDMTPVAISYAFEHWTARQFNDQYLGRVDDLRDEPEEVAPAPPPTNPPPAPDTAPTAHTPPATNGLGLPKGAPDDYNELIAFLKDKGLTVPRNMKKQAAIDLYKQWEEEQKEKGIAGFADRLYETYCTAVGGVAFKGDPLPTWPEFRADPTKEKQSNAWLMTAEMLLEGRSAITTPEQTAEHIYTSYCTAVGGVAFNGDPLPTWPEFRADPDKEKQSNAWIITAELVIKLLGAPLVMKAWTINGTDLVAAPTREDAITLWDGIKEGEPDAVSTSKDFTIEECSPGVEVSPDERPENSIPVWDYVKGLTAPAYLGSLED